MATTVDYIEFVCEQLKDFKNVRYRKMFGDYMVYVNDKPLLLVCDSIVYVKMLPQVADLLSGAETGIPYEGSKEHYILDIENPELVKSVIETIEPITPLPKKRSKA